MSTTTEQKIKIMQDYLAGVPIYTRMKTGGKWTQVGGKSEPFWNWNKQEYRPLYETTLDSNPTGGWLADDPFRDPAAPRTLHGTKAKAIEEMKENGIPTCLIHVVEQKRIWMTEEFAEAWTSSCEEE